MPTWRLDQVDVFGAGPMAALGGNPLAVVHAADGLDDARMAALTRWTNLSEVTFLLPATDPAADYRVRIFSPVGELPFAGHPTLGSAWAWLAAGGRPRHADRVVQQCGVGLVTVRRDGARLAFAAPPRRRTGPLDAATLVQARRGLRLGDDVELQHQWVDNGPGWCALRLGSAAQVLALRPDWAALGTLKLGVVGPHPPGHEAAVEVRAFIGRGGDGFEDPVTGSLNASLAQWQLEAGWVPERFVAAQGTALQRSGRVHVAREGDAVWVGGAVTGVIQGTLSL